MRGILRVAGLVWAETVMEGVFFIMQTYFTSVWKMSFTNAATILNIWGGFYRILPFWFLFIAETLLGNFFILAFSSISSTAGLVLITVATTPVFGQTVSSGRCEDKEGCVGYTEKILFITGMALIGLGRAARVATAEPFIDDQIQTTGHDQHLHNNTEQTTNHEEEDPPNNIEQTTKHEGDQTDNRPLLNWWRITCVLVFFCTPLVVIFAFPYIKTWYVLFGLSACCTILATLFFLIGAHAYNKPKPKAERSPITDFARVFVAAAFKITQPLPKDDDTRLHRVVGEEIQSLSPTRILGFLHKAAIVKPGEIPRSGSWKLCSVSEVESAKALICLVPIMSCFIMCGIVHSTANTYFLEQASHMKFNIGKWKPPLQLMLLISAFGKYTMIISVKLARDMFGMHAAEGSGKIFIVYSVVCCAVAAAVERRRIHVLRRHDLLDLPDDGKVPMSAGWLIFQIYFAGMMEPCFEYGFSAFLEDRAPESMKRYHDCIVEGVTGFGFLCTACSVIVVGKVSETGGGKNWFQFTLNRSRLDRYYWVLTVLCSLNVLAYYCLNYIYTITIRSDEELPDGSIHGSTFELNAYEFSSYAFPITKGTAVELVLRHYKLSTPIDQVLENRNQ